ncbi:MAG TPA: alpha/beta hydrolase [Aquella sp.]|nr:alpha/beta hydrolase [Aquella sp.]
MKKALIWLFLSINLCCAFTLPKQTLTIGDHKLNYYKVGHGKPVVLIMGYGLTNNFWPKPFIKCLSYSRTLYILDYIQVDKPNMDLMVDEVYTFIRKVDLDHPEVIGWSMGGGVALSLANKYPYSVSKLGLISTVVAEPSISQIVTPYTAKDNSTDERLNYIFGNNIHNYQAKHLPKYKKEMLSEVVFVNEKVLNSQKAMLTNWMSNPDNSTMVRHLKVPMDVIIAKHDAILNPQVELQVFQNHPKAKVAIIDSGHASFYEKPKQVCESILQ